MSNSERYCFLVDWFDAHAQLTRQYHFFFYPQDNSVEMYDIKNHRTFLKRTKYETRLMDLYIDAAINVFGRQLVVKDFGDDFTREKLGKKMERHVFQATLLLIGPGGFQHCGGILDAVLEKGFKLCRMRMFGFTPVQSQQLRGAMPGLSSNSEKLSHGQSVAIELMCANAVDQLRNLIGSSKGVLRQQVDAGNVSAASSSSEVKQAAEFLFSPDANKKFKRTARFDNCTLALIKPHAANSDIFVSPEHIQQGLVGKIIGEILTSGFEITDLELFLLEKANAEEFLEVYQGVIPEYHLVLDELTSGTVIAMEITSKGGQSTAGNSNIVKEFREFCGPTDPELARRLRPNSLRAHFGEDKVKNAIHCTDLPDDGILENEAIMSAEVDQVERERIHKMTEMASAVKEGKLPSTDQAIQGLEKLRTSEELKEVVASMSPEGRKVMAKADQLMRDTQQAMAEVAPGSEAQQAVFYGTRAVSRMQEEGQAGKAATEAVIELAERSMALARVVASSAEFRRLLNEMVSIAKDIVQINVEKAKHKAGEKAEAEKAGEEYQPTGAGEEGQAQIEAAGAKISEAAGPAKEKLSEAGKAVSTKMQPSEGMGKEEAEGGRGIGEGISEAGRAATEKIRETGVSEAKDRLKETGQKVVEKMKPSGQGEEEEKGAGERVSASGRATKEAFKEAGEQVKGQATEVGKETFEKLKPSGGEETKEGGEGMGEKISRAGAQAKEKIIETGKQVAEKMKPSMGEEKETEMSETREGAPLEEKLSVKVGGPEERVSGPGEQTKRVEHEPRLMEALSLEKPSRRSSQTKELSTERVGRTSAAAEQNPENPSTQQRGTASQPEGQPERNVESGMEKVGQAGADTAKAGVDVAAQKAEGVIPEQARETAAEGAKAAVSDVQSGNPEKAAERSAEAFLQAAANTALVGVDVAAGKTEGVVPEGIRESAAENVKGAVSEVQGGKPAMQVAREKMSAAMEKAKEYAGISYEELELPEDKMTELISKIKATAKGIQAKREYQKAVEDLIEIISEIKRRTTSAAQTVTELSTMGVAPAAEGYAGPMAVAKEAPPPAEARVAIENARKLVENLAKSSLSPLIHDTKTLVQTMQYDEETQHTQQEVRDFLLLSIRDPNFVSSDDYEAKAKDLVWRMRTTIMSGEKGYDRMVRKILDDATEFGGKLSTGDETTQAVGKDMRELFKTAFMDEKGNYKFKPELVGDVARMLNVISDKLGYLPIPRLEVNDDETHWIFDNIILKSAAIAPSFIHVRTDTIVDTTAMSVEVGAGNVPAPQVVNAIMINISHIQASARDVVFMFNKKRGLLATGDVGRADFDIKDRGIEINVTVVPKVASFVSSAATATIALVKEGETASPTAVTLAEEKLREQPYEQMLTIRDMKVIVHNLSLRFHDTHHDWLYKLFSPLISQFARRQIENSIADSLRKLIFRLDTQLAAAAAGPVPEPQVAAIGVQPVLPAWQSKAYDV
ncbi:Nucleoside diphosphate kinase 7 [Quaeritorhiza haematococci]|nr:Nucleoside diphosphate kinase 7 [Quaeritorhiza haematococci]